MFHIATHNIGLGSYGKDIIFHATTTSQLNKPSKRYVNVLKKTLRKTLGCHFKKFKKPEKIYYRLRQLTMSMNLKVVIASFSSGTSDSSITNWPRYMNCRMCSKVLWLGNSIFTDFKFSFAFEMNIWRKNGDDVTMMTLCTLNVRDALLESMTWIWASDKTSYTGDKNTCLERVFKHKFFVQRGSE